MFDSSIAQRLACFFAAGLLSACGTTDDDPDTTVNEAGRASAAGFTGLAGSASGGNGGTAGGKEPSRPPGSGGASVAGGSGNETSGRGASSGAAGVSGRGGTGAGGSSGGAHGGANNGGASGGVASSAAAAGSSGADDRPPCMKNPNQVISMGDSYMNWLTHTFPEDLNAAAGATFRPTYAVGGFSMGSGGIGLIPALFDVAVTEDKDIIAIVLDGGGNDLLIPAIGRPDCKNMADAATTPGCQAIVTDALAAVRTLTQKIAASGVHDVIYYFYPRVPAPTILGGSNPNAMLDYSLPRTKAFCDGVVTETQGKLHCWFVDTIPLFDGHPEYFAPSDIHPNPQGSKLIAQAVVDKMKKQCIGQPLSSGCCKP